MFYVQWWTDYKAAEVHHFGSKSDYERWATAAIGPDKSDWPKLESVVPHVPKKAKGCYWNEAFWPKTSYRTRPTSPYWAEPGWSKWHADGKPPELDTWSRAGGFAAFGCGDTKEKAADDANARLREMAPTAHYDEGVSSNTSSGLLKLYTLLGY